MVGYSEVAVLKTVLTMGLGLPAKPQPCARKPLQKEKGRYRGVI